LIDLLNRIKLQLH